jgi:serine/threonine-protein kinase
VARDSEVVILVSGGPPAVEVPNVAGATEAAARERLEAAGFVVATSGELLTPDQRGVGAVLRQQPAAGTELRPDEVVTIVVGRVATHPPPMPTTTTTTAPPAPPGGGGG